MVDIGPTNATPVNGSPFNDRIIGGFTNQVINGLGGDDRIFGRGGNDRISGDAGDDFLSGETGNDRLFGEVGDDTLLGGSGDDTLVGAGRSNFGRGEVDVLTGGSGNDRFVLGDANNVYYNDGNILSTGTSDYAQITDFQAGQDTIQLKGGVNYILQNVALPNGVSGRGIYVDNPGILPDELIGVIQGIQPFTPLQINNGAAITTITGLGLAPSV